MSKAAGMIGATALAQCFEEIIGWPYVSPGTNDHSGIDCSGAFVRAYRKHGLTIAHGSNSIFRKHCGVTGLIGGDASRLHVGMAVFKQRRDGQEPAKYQGDGMGNMYHIGLVTGVKPLRIVHATVPAAKADTALGKWSHYGWLDEVSYAGNDEAAAPTLPEMTEAEYLQEPATPASAPKYVRVLTPDGHGVRAREQPSLKAIYKYTVPDGTVLQVLADKGGFWRVHYLGKARYVDKRFVVGQEG